MTVRRGHAVRKLSPGEPVDTDRSGASGRTLHRHETASNAGIYVHRAGGAFLTASVEGRDTE
jgi:aminoglycoside phosphotransferase